MKKNYIVPAFAYCRFGCERRVEADSPQDAAARVRNGEGVNVGDAYDWNRFHEDSVKVEASWEIREDTT
jgi:hypothetical protein